MDSPSRLLVCDAPSLVMEDLLPFLRELGYACTYVQDVKDLAPGDALPDAVILSAAIPGGAHGRAFARLREAFSGIPLLVVAHVRSLSTAIEYFRAGADDYLPAPLTPEDTRERIEVARQRSRSLREAGVETVEVESAAVAGREAGEDVSAQPADTAAGSGVDLEILPCGVWLSQGAASPSRANAAALSLLGCPSAAALGQALEDPLASMEPRDAQGRALSADAWPPAQARRHKARRGATVSLKRPDGTRVWVRLEALPVVHAGQVLQVVVTLTNVTEEGCELQRLRRRG